MALTYAIPSQKNINKCKKQINASKYTDRAFADYVTVTQIPAEHKHRHKHIDSDTVTDTSA